MKVLTCDICGSTDIVKDGGVFVCQSCGTKYSVAEARRMMSDDTVDSNSVPSTPSVEAKPQELTTSVSAPVSGVPVPEVPVLSDAPLSEENKAKVDNFKKLALTAIGNSNGKEAYSYANRIIEISPADAEAWFIRMKAIGLTAILNDLKVKDVIAAGRNVIRYNPGMELDVYKYYLKKMLADLKICTSRMGECESYRLLYEANKRVDPNTATEKTNNSDTIYRIISVQVVNVLFLRSEVPDRYVSNNPIIADLVAEIAVQWIHYTRAVNRHLNSYNYQISDETAESFKKYLQKIKSGLTIDKMQETSEENIVPVVPASGGCYVATAIYGSYDCPEVWTLRRYRDNTLAETWYGRAFIHTYYAVSPTLVRWFGGASWFRNLFKNPLDHLVNKLQSEGVESTPYIDKCW